MLHYCKTHDKRTLDKMKKLFIFDLDGTILDTLNDLYSAVNYSLEKNRLPVRNKNEVAAFTGNGIRRLIDLSVPDDTPERVTDAVFDDFKTYYAEHCNDSTRPYDGVKEVLSELKAKGCLLAVVSNKIDSAVQNLVNQHFPDMFDSVTGQKDGIRKKPYPDSVNFVLTTLNVPRSEAVYIGDSEVDIATAKNADLPCVSVCWGFRSEPYLKSVGATTLIRSPKELLNIK